MQKRLDGTLKRAKMDWLRNCTKKRVANNVCEKRKARRTGYARRELQERAHRDDD